MYATAATTTTATTMRAALGKTAQLGARHGRMVHAGARASRGAARAQQQDEEQQEQQQQQSSSSSMQKSPMGGSTLAFRRGALPVGLTSLLGRDFPSVMSSPFALTDRMFDMLDFPSEFREMYEPFQRLMHRDSVSALPDKLAFAVNILEKKDHYLLTADLPGLSSSNVKVTVDSDKQLHIKALRESRHEEESDDAGVKIHAYERSFGSYDRKFQLPESVDADAEDAVQASMKDGVLSVRIKKTPSPEPEIPKPMERQIEIKTAA
jgi:HSP20 family molecular chaperone IbpA